jgi:hypothetical protein
LAPLVRSASFGFPGDLPERRPEDSDHRHAGDDLSRPDRPLGDHDGDPLPDDDRGADQPCHRHPTWGLGCAIVTRRAADPTVPGCNADHPCTDLFHPDRPLLRHPKGAGHPRHHHLCPAPRGSIDHPRDSGRPPAVGGGCGDVRLDPPPDPVQGATSDRCLRS